MPTHPTVDTDAPDSAQTATDDTAKAPGVETQQASEKVNSIRSSASTTPVKRKPSEASRLRAAAVRARKLDAIATRRALAAKMTKVEFISEIVKGRFKPITAEEIAAEPTPPVVVAVATPAAASPAETAPTKADAAPAEPAAQAP